MMANSNFVLTVSFALLVGAASAVKQINDIKKYPACLVDNDCTEMHKLRDHACFQYFCYPWKSMPDVASAPPRPLQECRRASDCPSVTHPSGNKKQPFQKEAEPQVCFRHHDRRRINSGICIDSRDECSSHDQCQGKGGKCCNGFCCNGQYFEAIKNFECMGKLGCEDLLTGNNCCIDVMGSVKGSTRANWEKKCCYREPDQHLALPPPQNISAQDKAGINDQIKRMGDVAPSMKQTICKSMGYEQMIGYSHCTDFTTTTTTATTTTTPKATPPPPTPGQSVSRASSFDEAGAIAISIVLSLIPYHLVN